MRSHLNIKQNEKGFKPFIKMGAVSGNFLNPQ
jgi:hypothetical protein